MARVLLVDDDIAEISAVKRVLARAGHQSVLATNAADALSALSRAAPALVLVGASCDNGDAVLRFAEAQSARAVPLLILGETSSAPARAVQIPRPVDPDQLATEVASVLGTAPVKVARVRALAQPRGAASQRSASRGPAAPADDPAQASAPRRTMASSAGGRQPSGPPQAAAARKAAAEALRARAAELRRTHPAAPAATPRSPPKSDGGRSRDHASALLSPDPAPSAGLDPERDPGLEEILRRAEEAERAHAAERKARARQADRAVVEAYQRAEAEQIAIETAARARAAEERARKEERARAEAERKAQQDAEARARAEEERRLVEEQARRRTAEEARRAQLVKRRAEEEKRRAHEAKRHAEEQARQAEEEKQRALEAKRLADEEGRRAEKERRKALELKRRAEEEVRRAAEEKRRAEEEARRAAKERSRAEEEARKAAEEKSRAEEEARRAADEKSRAEEEARRAAEEKSRAEEEAHRAAQEKSRAEEEQRRVVAARRRARAERQARAELEGELDRLRKEAAEDARKREADEEELRTAIASARTEMDSLRRRGEEEARRRADAEAELVRLAKEAERKAAEAAAQPDPFDFPFYEPPADDPPPQAAHGRRVSALREHPSGAAPSHPDPEPLEPEPPPRRVIRPPPAELRSGTLSEIPIPRLLALAARAEVSGRIDFKRDVSRSLYFEDGRIVGSSSADPADRVEQLALRLGLVTRDQYRVVATAAAPLATRRAALMLVERGFLKQSELTGLVRRRTEEVVFGVFGDPAARFRWTPAEVPPDERTTLERTALQLAVEGIRRRWRAPQLEPILGGDATLLAPLTTGPTAADLGLAPEEERVLALADGLRTLDEVIAASPLDALSTCQALAALVLVGALAVRTFHGGRPASAATAAIDMARLRDKHDQVRRADYFTILGVGRLCTPHEVREAFERLQVEFDPARLQGINEEGLDLHLDEIRRVLADARDVLADERLRDEYLRGLGE